ncbi:ExeA family protein [Alishewanella sp. SMS8]|uniref:ExeA family protein n=1 Tax=unclassified Alishewanella TaxID=2628974 RepID=UPI002741FDA9|nr:AAA family ATPase [Alishewanella sp. SMS8]MDP4944289.1 AAA family ATPase [Alishewanella sp.]MDP5035201.1 AAA family ATPase [Alishewanella sp.]MDP5185613.1 AAA family ATPase [Alishewanella sp.]MDP5459661.1 AAA family ATPase [Alishewanella sp. SMS8]
MYTGFFGLNSAPFSIAPNPDFMYLSPRHAEALAHLRYGLGDAGGFVLLTGEVGTGKTTVSRSLLQELDETTDVAFILNPTLSELELLAAICDELKIRYRKTDASLKLLGDKITQRLQKNHDAGKKTILIIDEAQHLQPAVLEQLRLLTNLETNTKKLLQVILIGQPELQQLLQRNDLRQLAQRITARYHLLPLNLAEVQQYMRYRLQVAGCQRPVFSDKAVKKLFELSGGIPRLLNLLADRALLAAYSQQQALVELTHVQRAAAEILPSHPATSQRQALPNWLWPLLALLGIILGFLLALQIVPILRGE